MLVVRLSCLFLRPLNKRERLHICKCFVKQCFGLFFFVIICWLQLQSPPKSDLGLLNKISSSWFKIELRARCILKLIGMNQPRYWPSSPWKLLGCVLRSLCMSPQDVGVQLIDGLWYLPRPVSLMFPVETLLQCALRTAWLWRTCPLVSAGRSVRARFCLHSKPQRATAV